MRNPASICWKLVVNLRKGNDNAIFQNEVIFSFFDVGVFLLSRLINGPSFMSISSLVLELWQFFYKRLNRNPELETLPSEFCPISGDWGKLQISNLAQISLIKSYGILQNIRVTAFAVSELLREKNREMA